MSRKRKPTVIEAKMQELISLAIARKQFTLARELTKLLEALDVSGLNVAQKEGEEK